MSDFVPVRPADPTTEAGDMALAAVPAAVAYLGLAVLDAIQHGEDGDMYQNDDGSLYLSVQVWHPRPRLLAELRRAGVIR